MRSVIGNEMQRAFHIAQHRNAQGQALDRTADAPDFNPIPDRVLILQQNEEAVEEITDQRLCAEGEGQTHDPGGGQ